MITEYTLHKAAPTDIDEVLRITSEARAYQQSVGNAQWVNGYPGRELIMRDIAGGGAVVLRVGGRTEGYAVIVVRDEGYAGAWQWPEPTREWCVIHRLALSDACRGRGLASRFLLAIIKEAQARGIEEVRIDTGVDNRPVQHIAAKLGFTRLGETDFTWGRRVVYRLTTGG